MKGIIKVEIVGVLILSALLIFIAYGSGIIQWSNPANIINPSPTSVHCNNGNIYFILERTVDTGHADEMIFPHDSASITCSEWQDFGFGNIDPTIIVKYNDIDVTPYYDIVHYENTMNTGIPLTWYSGARVKNIDTFTDYMNNVHGIPFSSDEQYPFKVTIYFTDLCYEKICDDNVRTCPDGYVDRCPTTCIPETGQCTQCFPACEGHDIPEEECRTEYDCPCIIQLDYTCQCIDGECVSEPIQNEDYSILLIIVAIVLIIATLLMIYHLIKS